MYRVRVTDTCLEGSAQGDIIYRQEVENLDLDALVALVDAATEKVSYSIRVIRYEDNSSSNYATIYEQEVDSLDLWALMRLITPNPCGRSGK